jgi:hypothetical protein
MASSPGRGDAPIARFGRAYPSCAAELEAGPNVAAPPEIDTFLKGPVCNGSIAVNSIQEQFFASFLRPDAAHRRQEPSGAAARRHQGAGPGAIRHHIRQLARGSGGGSIRPRGPVLPVAGPFDLDQGHPRPNARSSAMFAPDGMASVVAYRGIIGDAGIVAALMACHTDSTNQNSLSLSFRDTRRLPTRRRNAIT